MSDVSTDNVLSLDSNKSRYGRLKPRPGKLKPHFGLICPRSGKNKANPEAVKKKRHRRERLFSSNKSKLRNEPNEDIDTFEMFEDIGNEPTEDIDTFEMFEDIAEEDVDDVVIVVENDNGNFICEKEDVLSELTKMGLSAHLKTVAGCQEQQSSQIIGNIAHFLMWKRSESDRYGPWVQHDLERQIDEMLLALVQHEYKSLQDYVIYLTKIRFLKPSTIINTINNIRGACQWFVLFRESPTVGHIEPSAINALSYVVRATARTQRKQAI
jgi:hypothetical protein